MRLGRPEVDGRTSPPLMRSGIEAFDISDSTVSASMIWQLQVEFY